MVEAKDMVTIKYSGHDKSPEITVGGKRVPRALSVDFHHDAKGSPIATIKVLSPVALLKLKKENVEFKEIDIDVNALIIENKELKSEISGLLDDIEKLTDG